MAQAAPLPKRHSPSAAAWTVIVEHDRHRQRLGEAVAQGHVAPAGEGGRGDGDAGVGIERPRRTDADAEDFEIGSLGAHGAGEDGHLGDHRVRSRRRLGLHLGVGEHAAGFAHDRRAQLRAAEIEADRRAAHEASASGAGRPRTQAMRAARSGAP